jgi:hypothetical protein
MSETYTEELGVVAVRGGAFTPSPAQIMYLLYSHADSLVVFNVKRILEIYNDDKRNFSVAEDRQLVEGLHALISIVGVKAYVQAAERAVEEFRQMTRLEPSQIIVPGEIWLGRIEGEL